MAGSKGGRGGQGWRTTLRRMAKQGVVPNAIVGSPQQQSEVFKEINRLYEMPDVNGTVIDQGDAVYVMFKGGASETRRVRYPSGVNATQEEKDGTLKWLIIGRKQKK